ncbi:hypothetical protein PM082_009275 [Marasmius tenuissimus]|nr:hypothetical protein PM082_009275 [Marasmius tenuissimus]
MYGHIDISKSRQQCQQPIYLFVRPPPLDLLDSKTSSVHFWSFHEDGRIPLSADICSDFGLPFQLESYSPWCYLVPCPTKTYKLIHRYQLLRGVDPTTTNFACLLGYVFTFQPISDSDRFTEAYEEEDTNHPRSPDVLARSSDSESSLDMQDHGPGSDAIFKGKQGQGAAEGESITKKQKTNVEFRGMETFHHPVEDPCHKNDITTIDQTTEEQGLRSLQPLPAIILPCAGASNLHSLEHVHSRQMHQSQVHPRGRDDNQRHFPYPYLSQNFSPGYPSLSTLNTPAPMDFNSLSMGRTPAWWPGIPQHVSNQSPITSFNITARHGEDIAQTVGWPPGMSYIAPPTVVNSSYNCSPGTVAPTRLGMPQFMTMADPLVASSSFKAGSANLDNRSSAIMSNPVYTDPMSVCSPTNAAQRAGPSGLTQVALAGSSIVDDANIGPPGDYRCTSHREERIQPPCSLSTSATRTGGVVDVVGWTSPAFTPSNIFPSLVAFLRICMCINAL